MYIAAIAFELVAFIVGYNILDAMHRLDLVIPLLAFVVGLHFLGLLPVFQTTRYITIAVVFCFIALIGISRNWRTCDQTRLSLEGISFLVQCLNKHWID